jgi:hypothetical protein
MAQALNLTPLGDGKPPVRQDLGRFQMFADQALRMGLSGDQAQDVVASVKDGGEISPRLREQLQFSVAENKGWTPGRVEREMDQLERRAAMLPNEIQAVGARPMDDNLNPSAPPPPPPPSRGPDLPPEGGNAMAAAVAEAQARRLSAISNASGRSEVASPPMGASGTQYQSRPEVILSASSAPMTAAASQPLDSQPQTPPPPRPTSLPMPTPPDSTPRRQGLPIPQPPSGKKEEGE